LVEKQHRYASANTTPMLPQANARVDALAIIAMDAICSKSIAWVFASLEECSQNKAD